MIGHCFNPECQKELQYLRQGSVFHWESGRGCGARSEFFWLCSSCSCQFDLRFDADERPLLAPSGTKRECREGCSRIRRVFQKFLQDRPEDPQPLLREHGHATARTCSEGKAK